MSMKAAINAIADEVRLTPGVVSAKDDHGRKARASLAVALPIRAADATLAGSLPRVRVAVGHLSRIPSA